MHADQDDENLQVRLGDLRRQLRPSAIHARNWGSWPDTAISSRLVRSAISLARSLRGVDGSEPVPFRLRLACRAMAGMAADVSIVSQAVKRVLVGEREGPLHPDSAAAVIILAGHSPAAVDAVAARLIGLDPAKTPLLRNALALLSRELPSCDIRLVGEHGTTRLDDLEPLIRVRPPAHWVGHVELAQRTPEGGVRQSTKAPAHAGEAPA